MMEPNLNFAVAKSTIAMCIYLVYFDLLIQSQLDESSDQ